MIAHPTTCRMARPITAAAMFVVFNFAATADTLYWGGGTTDIADNTALPISTNQLNGVWGTTPKNWATGPNGASYAAFADGAYAQLGYYTNGANVVITLQGNKTVSGLTACLNATYDYNRRFVLDAAAPVSVTSSGETLEVNTASNDGTRGINFLANVALAGSMDVEKLGGGVWELQSISDGFAGAVNVRQGQATLAGSLAGVPTFNLHGRLCNATTSGYGGNEFSAGTLRVNAASGANNKLKDDAVVSLRRGSFTYVTQATTTETIGQVAVETWGTIGSTEGYAGGILTLGDSTAGLTRGSLGLGMLVFSSVSGSSTLLKLRVPNGLTTDTLVPWIITPRAEFLLADSSNNNTLTLIVPTEAATDLSSWTSLYGPTTNVRIGNNTSIALANAVSDNLTLRSLAFYNTTATTLQIATGKTLTLGSGGLAFRAPVSGQNQTIAGGFLTSGTSELLLNSSDSNSSQTLVIQSPVTGSGMDVLKAGIAAVQFAGTEANTYSGDTHVLCGGLSLSKSANVIAIPGNLRVYPGGSVSWGNTGQLAGTADVTLFEDSLLSMRDQTFGGTVTVQGGTIFTPNSTITFNKAGTGLVFNGGWINYSSSHSGGINLQTDVRYEEVATRQARFEIQSVDTATMGFPIKLNGGNRTFNIADSATLPEGVPEMVVDLQIVPGSPAGGALTKTGSGVLQLTSTNSYAGGTTVNGGTLHVATISAPARSGLTGYTGSTGSSTTLVVFNEPVAKSMVARQPITGSTVSASRIVARVLNDYEVLTNGGNVTGVSTNIAVGAISRSGDLGLGAVAVNNTGTLKIDPGITITNSVAINAGGTLVSSGATMRNVTITGGTLAVDLTKGVMNSTGTVLLADAEITITGAIPSMPVAVLTTTGTLTGSFSSWTEGYKVTYDGNMVLVGPAPAGGTVVLVR